MSEVNIRYPIINFKSKGDFEIITDEEVFTTMKMYAIKRRLYKDYIIVDSNLKNYIVTGIKVLGGKGSFWGYTDCLDRIVQVRLDIEVKFPPLCFTDVKKRVIRDIKLHNSWRASDPDWKEYLQKVSVTETISDLILLLIDEYDKRSSLAKYKKGLFDGF